MRTLAAPTRSWTAVGALGSGPRAVVDPHGVVLLDGAAWALEVAVGAEDRWYRFVHEPSVRQRLLGDGPVLETRLRVPGGDVVHRAYAANPAGAGAPVVVVEVENQTAVPVALALGIAPTERGGPWVAVDDDRVRLGDREVVRLARAPRHVLVGAEALGEVVAGAEAPATGPGGAAEAAPSAALVLPLAHTATLRLVVAADVDGELPDPASLPGADAVARGWEVQRNRAARLRVPDARVQAVDEAARSTLLLLTTEDGVRDELGRPLDATAEALALAALAGRGLLDEPRGVLAALGDRQGRDGWIGDEDDPASTGALLWALGELVVGAGAVELAPALAPMVAGGASAIERRRRSRRRRGGAPPGLLPAGWAPDWVGGPGVRAWHDLWAVAGLRAAARVLAVADEAPGARAAAVAADELGAALRAALVGAGDDLAALGVGDLEEPRAAGDALLVGHAILGVLDDEVAARLVQDARARRGEEPGVPAEDGSLDVRASLLLAHAELAIGEVAGRDALVRLVGAAGHALSLPDRLDDADRRGVGAHGHDAISTALAVHAARALVVHERADGLDLVPVAPAAWWGQRWELLGAPTRHGSVSVAVRWTDDRPTLLWELDARHPDTAVVLRAPGLAPDLVTTEHRGEVELPAIAAPGGEVEARRRRRIQVAMGGAAATNPTHGHGDPEPGAGT